ncbi:MAG: hypothetical protein M3425_10130, partial [Actinomycetota bacterium]|nr:hypothetical protein [Actinomycetota bacterium]
MATAEVRLRPRAASGARLGDHAVALGALGLLIVATIASGFAADFPQAWYAGVAGAGDAAA